MPKDLPLFTQEAPSQETLPDEVVEKSENVSADLWEENGEGETETVANELVLEESFQEPPVDRHHITQREVSPHLVSDAAEDMKDDTWEMAEEVANEVLVEEKLAEGVHRQEIEKEVEVVAKPLAQSLPIEEETPVREDEPREESREEPKREVIQQTSPVVADKETKKEGQVSGVPQESSVPTIETKPHDEGTMSPAPVQIKGEGKDDRPLLESDASISNKLEQITTREKKTPPQVPEKIPLAQPLQLEGTSVETTIMAGLPVAAENGTPSNVDQVIHPEKTSQETQPQLVKRETAPEGKSSPILLFESDQLMVDVSDVLPLEAIEAHENKGEQEEELIAIVESEEGILISRKREEIEGEYESENIQPQMVESPSELAQAVEVGLAMLLSMEASAKVSPEAGEEGAGEQEPIESTKEMKILITPELLDFINEVLLSVAVEDEEKVKERVMEDRKTVMFITDGEEPKELSVTKDQLSSLQEILSILGEQGEESLPEEVSENDQEDKSLVTLEVILELVEENEEAGEEKAIIPITHETMSMLKEEIEKEDEKSGDTKEDVPSLVFTTNHEDEKSQAKGQMIILRSKDEELMIDKETLKKLMEIKRKKAATSQLPIFPRGVAIEELVYDDSKSKKGYIQTEWFDAQVIMLLLSLFDNDSFFWEDEYTFLQVNTPSLFRDEESNLLQIS